MKTARDCLSSQLSSTSKVGHITNDLNIAGKQRMTRNADVQYYSESAL